MSTRDKYISSAMLLLASSVVVKVISAVYKIPLTSFIGAVGRGYFASAYNLCLPLHAITMGSLPVALSKLVSKYNASDNLHMVYSLKKASSGLFSLVGVVGMVLMMIVAIPYSRYVASSKCLYTCLVLAPSILFSCMAASYRAYFEGYMNMVPTSVSQLLEAVFKMLFGLLFARLSMIYMYNMYESTGKIFGSYVSSSEQALSAIYPFTSAGAMLGVSLGSLVSLFYVVIYYSINKQDVKFKNPDIKGARTELLGFAFPIMMSCVFQGIFQFLDTASVQKALSLIPLDLLKGRYADVLRLSGTPDEDIQTYAFGLLNSALDFKNLVPGIAMALGVCAVPAVSSAFEKGDRAHLSSLITSVYKYTSLLSSLGMVIMFTMSKDILLLFYGNNSQDIVVGCDSLVRGFALVIPLYCVSGIAVCIVQALGAPQKSIKPFVISGIIRVVLNIVLISNVRLVLMGDVLSDAVGYLIMCICNIVIACRLSGVKFSLMEIAVKPLVISLITYTLLNGFINNFIFDFGIVFNLLIKLSICGVLFSILCFLFKSLNFREIFLLKKH